MIEPTSERGVYRLAAAVLVQAIQDATSMSMGRRAGAIRWISSNQEGGYSFIFVCRALNRDPAVVRLFCQREIARRRLPEVRWYDLPEAPPIASSGPYASSA
jgi:hypothetical protein